MVYLQIMHVLSVYVYKSEQMNTLIMPCSKLKQISQPHFIYRKSLVFKTICEVYVKIKKKDLWYLVFSVGPNAYMRDLGPYYLPG